MYVHVVHTSTFHIHKVWYDDAVKQNTSHAYASENDIVDKLGQNETTGYVRDVTTD